ncbi:MAG: succinate dehydrogenase, hydrophobic membrane anchor protein [Woeseiaceae bacterium]
MSSSATGHFIAQRASAIVLVILGLWFAVAISGLGGTEHATVLAFVAQPMNSVLLAFLCAALAYHSYLGVQVVIDDYVHAPRLNWLSLLASRVAHLLVGLVSIFTIYDIGFGA